MAGRSGIRAATIRRRTWCFSVRHPYDTAPLRDRVPDPSCQHRRAVHERHVALNPDTGKLAWHYSAPAERSVGSRLGVRAADLRHERQRREQPRRRHRRKDRHLRRAGGQDREIPHLDGSRFSNPGEVDRSGHRRQDIDREHITPGDGTAKFLCPHSEGGKNWIPDAYNPKSKLIFVPLVESCQDLAPVAAGERGLLSTGVRLSLRPPPTPTATTGGSRRSTSRRRSRCGSTVSARRARPARWPPPAGWSLPATSTAASRRSTRQPARSCGTRA